MFSISGPVTAVAGGNNAASGELPWPFQLWCLVFLEYDLSCGIRGGGRSTMDSILASHPLTPGSNLGSSEIFALITA